VYNNNAGGATSAARAAVAIDLAGNDRYERALTGSVGNAQIVAQGAGLMGVGLLLDAAGADTYSASIALTPPELAAPPAATLLVQGAAAAGAGALIDLAGPDTFSASASTLGGPAVAAAQGAASLGGVGLLSARGPDTGSRYTATATSGALLTARTATTQTFTIGTSSVYAQGGATTGAGVLVDEAGADIYAARSHSGAAVAYAQGGGVGGAVLVDREGSDTMFAESVADAVLDADWPVTCPPGNTCSFTGALTAEVGMAVIDAHGASDGGFALLADQGAAPNTHEAIARIAPVARSTVHFAGGGGAAGTLTSTVSLNVPTDVRLHADGYANVGGVGMALGGDGSDAWIGRAHVTATAVATSTGGATNAATATATASDAEGNAQGFGALGAGVLNDPGGADTYLVTESTGFSATRNGLPGSGFAGINRFYGRGFAVQGPPPIGTPGAGILVDLGGVDSYSPVYLGTFPGTNERCWSNSAGAPGEVGVGMDVWSNGLGPLPSGCAPPPN
ncbi:MAG TPA: hypothetical protein VGR28_01940, partial [Candidatus Thermoplasmatota archaeon]|nr:hypothetical protein [Candidatus Thermoplasmatota archaeon]